MAERFGARLHAWRAHGGYPLRAVAKKLGVSVSVISQWERAQRFPSLRNLEGIESILGIPVAYLFCKRQKGCPNSGLLGD